MSAGLFALLDDVAAIAKAAAASVDDVAAAAGKAAVKAAGVVVDDTAVTPRYVSGIEPHRELPVVRRIAVGSIRNKLLLILPLLLVLSELAPWALPPILLLGGAYLAFEGAEKVWEWRSGHDDEVGDLPAVHGDTEDALVRGAIRTDLVLSAEIMMIAAGSVADQGLAARAAILVFVALVITVGVYGLVGLIVKMDDVGLHLMGRPMPGTRLLGRALVAGMPRLLSLLSVVGVLAMLWVGGHILLAQTAALGWHEPEHLVETWAHPLGGIGGWLATTTIAAIIGLVVGGAIAAGAHVVRHRSR